ncbi:unnamed protein product [Thelazia callipaeda]|uniref:Uncharacterized protein n=1 Tax=Thelazia callipaeda TaxID=103827 RepID=A0A0N5D7H7_THECL|nr:unnamed protein product [Thelazia callipaeda]
MAVLKHLNFIMLPIVTVLLFVQISQTRFHPLDKTEIKETNYRSMKILIKRADFQMKRFYLWEELKRTKDKSKEEAFKEKHRLGTLANGRDALTNQDDQLYYPIYPF